MEYETLLYDVADEVATVTLNRPAKMNAYTTTMGAEITDAMFAPTLTTASASSS